MDEQLAEVLKTVTSRRVIVTELEDASAGKNWEATDLTYGWTRKYKNLTGVLEALKRHDVKAAARGISTVTTVEYNYKTRAGHAIIKALVE